MIIANDQGNLRGVSIDLTDLFPNSEYSINIQQRPMLPVIGSKSNNRQESNLHQKNSVENIWSPPLTLNIVTLPDG